MNSVALFLSAIRENDRFFVRWYIGKVFDSRVKITRFDFREKATELEFFLFLLSSIYLEAFTTIKVLGRYEEEKILVHSFQIAIRTS